jgi:oligopeptidase B
LGTDPDSDSLRLEERDEAYYLGLSKTKSKKYIIVDLESNTTNETWYLEADKPNSKFTLMAQRQHDIQYYIDHQEGKFYILTNENAKNSKVMVTSTANPAKSNWKEYIAHRDSVKIDAIDAFKNYLVVHERSGGLQKIRIINPETGNDHYAVLPDPAYSIYPGPNPIYDTSKLRFRYSSLVTPNSVYDYDMDTRNLELIKQNEIKGYDKANFQMERLFAGASDGAQIPIVLVYRKDHFHADGSNPLYLEGYGAYGISSDADFSSSRISLLDRGVVYAIGQIRGGSELGRWWYDQGKLFNKKNTFTDFITCAEYLIDKKYTSKTGLVIAGGSAGGLLIGAVTNMRPDLFKVVVAQVPFVDMLNTMLDPTIPLTVTEYEEWGNPNDSAYYFYMKSYSPYDNVEKKAYPAMLVTGGLNDPRVGYWEPTKWVAKLRAKKTDSNILLLKINMGEGHFGVSGRYAGLKDVAFEYAFCLDQLGIKQ